MRLLTHLPELDVENIDYYAILGVPRTASKRDIHKAFRRLSKRMHPDGGGDPAQFRRLTEAYETLSDPEARFNYDTFRLTRAELHGAVSELLNLVVLGYSRGIETQREIKAFAVDSLEKVRTKIRQDLQQLEGFKPPLERFIEQALSENFIMELAVKQARDQLVAMEKDCEMARKRLARCDTVEQLLEHLSLLKKEPIPKPQTTSWNHYTSSNVTFRFSRYG